MPFTADALFNVNRDQLDFIYWESTRLTEGNNYLATQNNNTFYYASQFPVNCKLYNRSYNVIDIFIS